MQPMMSMVLDSAFSKARYEARLKAEAYNTFDGDNIKRFNAAVAVGLTTDDAFNYAKGDSASSVQRYEYAKVQADNMATIVAGKGYELAQY